jgi:V-type H+-transporting ATPase 16kDa proteolipid subunit
MGTWKSGVSIVHTGIRHPSSVMKNVIPIVMAGVIGIYGLIVGVIIGQSIVQPTGDRENVYSTYTGMAHLCAGLCCGISGLAAGLCIGIVGDYGIRAVGYRASQITLFPTDKEAAGYSNVPDSDAGGGGGHHSEDISGSDDQNKLFVGMLIMLIFSEALALYGMIVALIVSQHSYSCL